MNLLLTSLFFLTALSSQAKGDDIAKHCTKALSEGNCGRKAGQKGPITQEELRCLNSLAHRNTRDFIRWFDGTKCADAVRAAKIEIQKGIDLYSGEDSEYEKYERSLADQCYKEAVSHCDKKTENWHISKSEYSCLAKIANRVTRNGHPMDGTKCNTFLREIRSRSKNEGKGRAADQKGGASLELKSN